MLESASVKRIAREGGFDLCGITSPDVVPEAAARFDEWLADGHHAEMEWLATSRDRRMNPANSLPGTKSIIMLGLNYYNPDTKETHKGHGRVSRYARGRDYHKVIAGMIKRLIARFNEVAPDESFYWYVDYGPLLERVHAQQAGLGYIGKNSMLINSEFASWIFLAEILTTARLQPDSPQPDIHGDCGECSLCIDSCPTGAIVDEGVVDSRRCLSYLTIERPSTIPDEYARNMGEWVFGCDVCQDVCPHNLHARLTTHADLLPEAGVGETLEIRRILTLQGRDQFLRLTAGTPLTRPKLDGLQRNAKIVQENWRRSSD